MSIERSEQCVDNHGGIDELYVFEYVKYSRSQINVTDNILNLFPFTVIYDLNALNVSFPESIDEEDGGVVYSQSGGFDLAKVLPTDNYKQFAEKDWRIIIKDNNGYYRLLGLYTGLTIKFTKEIGTGLGDFNGFKFTFETKEENTAPFLNDLNGFEIFDPLFAQSFTFIVKTDNIGDSLDNQVTIPTLGSGYNYNIKTDEGQIFNNLTGDYTITFTTAGTHEIRIKGAFPQMHFNNQGDKDKLLEVSKWGVYGVGTISQSQSFYGCTNLTTIADDVDNLNLIQDGNDMFYNCSLTSLPIGMTLPLLTDGNGIFLNNNLTSLPAGMTLPLLTNGFNMFRSNNLTSLPTLMTLPLLTNGSSMFYNCSLTSLPIGMTLPLLTNGNGMFLSNNLTSLLTGMTLPLLTNGSNMFRSNNLTSLPSGMTLPNLTNGNSMLLFNSLTSLPSGMELSNLTNGNNMFNGNSLTDLPTGMELLLLAEGDSMFLSNTINTTRYSQLYIDMEAGNPYNNVLFGGGNSKYNAAGETAKNDLIARGWIFTDGGLI